MRFGEAVRGDDTRALIEALGETINAAAQASGVDPNLISAIVYEEQTHLTPFEALAEKYLGAGDTVGLGQVTVGLNGFGRAELLDPATNIQAIATHLSSFSAQPTATQATKYNCGSCAQTSITEEELTTSALSFICNRSRRDGA